MPLRKENPLQRFETARLAEGNGSTTAPFPGISRLTFPVGGLAFRVGRDIARGWCW
jgi:hypothetical protein